jgi:catalase
MMSMGAVPPVAFRRLTDHGVDVDVVVELGCRIGVLITNGSDAAVIDELRAAVRGDGVRLMLIAPSLRGVSDGDGVNVVVDHGLGEVSARSFDAVVLAPSVTGGLQLADNDDAIAFARQAFVDLKVLGMNGAARLVMARAGVVDDDGVVAIDAPLGIARFVRALRRRVTAL